MPSPPHGQAADPGDRLETLGDHLETLGDKLETLGDKLERLGADLGAREAEHREDLAQARACAESLRGQVVSAIERFHRAATEAGAPHLQVLVGQIQTDDKHLRSVEFDLTRGRHRAIVTAKSRGEVTFVGPFRAGKVEGPCRSFSFDTTSEIDAALVDFLVRFVEEAATP